MWPAARPRGLTRGMKLKCRLNAGSADALVRIERAARKQFGILIQYPSSLNLKKHERTSLALRTRTSVLPEKEKHLGINPISPSQLPFPGRQVARPGRCFVIDNCCA